MDIENVPSTRPSTRQRHGPREAGNTDQQPTKSAETQSPFPLTRLPVELISEVFKTVVLAVDCREESVLDCPEFKTIPLKALQSLRLSSISGALRRVALATPPLWVYLFERMLPEGIDTFATRSGACLLHVRIDLWIFKRPLSPQRIHSLPRLLEHTARWGFLCSQGHFQALTPTVAQHGTVDLRKAQSPNLPVPAQVPSLTRIFLAMPSLRVWKVAGHGHSLGVSPVQTADGSMMALSADTVPPLLQSITLSRITMRLCDFETLLSSLRQSPAWQYLQAGDSKIDVRITAPAPGESPSHILSPTLRRLVDECKSNIEINIKLPEPPSAQNPQAHDVLAAFDFDFDPALLSRTDLQFWRCSF